MNDSIFDLIANYKTPPAVIDRLKNISTVIFTGITAAGKDTIMRDMLKDPRFVRVVTSTTRAPRANNGIMEENGREYYFLTMDQARENIEKGEYIEVNNVHEQANGSLISEYERIADADQIALSDIDYQGALNFLGFDMNKLLVVFIVPPNFEVWLERLKGRYGGSLEGNRKDIANRFRSAQREIAHALEDPRFIPIMNVESVRSAQEIMRIATTGELPSKEQITYAHTQLKALYDGLGNYIDLLSD